MQLNSVKITQTPILHRTASKHYSLVKKLAGANLSCPGAFHSHSAESSLGGYGGAGRNALTSDQRPQLIQRPAWHMVLKSMLEGAVIALSVLAVILLAATCALQVFQIYFAS